MPSTLLSLARARETNVTGWHRRDGGAYDTTYAAAIEEAVTTEPDRLLAAIPSPFARLHGYDFAFAFLSDPRTPLRGDSVFHASVSHCLDAMELLFNWQAHQRSGDPLTLIRWQPKQEIARLTKSRASGHVVLAEALDLYLGQDAAIGAQVRDEGLWLIALQQGSRSSVLVLASPLTLVAPGPDAKAAAAAAELRMPERDYSYFQETMPLNRRPPAFQAYMRSLFRARQGALALGCEHMFMYVTRVLNAPGAAPAAAGVGLDELDEINDPTTGLAISMHGVPLMSLRGGDVPAAIAQSPRRIKAERPGILPLPLILVDHITSTGREDLAFKAPPFDARPIEQRILPDFKIRYPFLLASDLFEDKIIRVPYALNTAAFFLPARPDGGEARCLPPIRRRFLEYFPESALGTRVSVRPVDGDGVQCDLQLPLVGGETLTLSKTYRPSPRQASDGQIIDADVDLIGFPAIRPVTAVTGEPVSPFAESTTFMLAELERSRTAGAPWRTDLMFYDVTAGGTVLPILQGVSIQARTPKAEPSFTGSKIFSLAHPLPPLIELIIAEDASTHTHALLCPTVRPRPVGQTAFDIAIDFGTTNTFVALGRHRQDGNAPDIQPLAFDADNLAATIALHAAGQRNHFIVANTERLASHEFVPTDLGTGRHTFPTRTALAERIDSRGQQLFTDVNIAFFLQRDAIRTGAEVVRTNLKWMARSDIATTERVKQFLRELLYLIRTRILLDGGDPRRSTLIWFWPLSFTSYLRDTLERLWREEAVAILGMPDTAIHTMTESAAPFYYHEARARLLSDHPVLSIDVGGGSTDVMFFEQGKPRFGTSFNFAGNAIWGDGFNRVKGPRDRNGVVDWAQPRVAKALQLLTDQEQRITAGEILQNLTDSLDASEEAINLYFAVDEQVRFTEQMRSEPVIKLMILLHYSAIVFHCAQLMRLRGLRRPEILCFSGAGSKALDVLDPTRDKRHLAEQAVRIFDLVYDQWPQVAAVVPTDDPDSGREIESIARRVKPSRQLRILMADRLKEATCEGGILGATAAADALHAEPNACVYLGGQEDTLYDRDEVITYDDLNRQPTIKADVAGNVRRFLAVFAGLATRYNTFDIPSDLLAKQRAALWAQTAEALELGLTRRLRLETSHERLAESLFFYPLIDKIAKMSQLLKPANAR